jgi:predicted flap endonuclease-1-like 5' DNA nuclease
MADDTPDAPYQQVPFSVPMLGGSPAPVGAETQTLAYSNDPALLQALATLQSQQDTLRAELLRLKEADLVQREKIVALQQKELLLQEQLADKRTAGREPDDFASAVSHSLDTLQSRLTGLSNGVTDFAVREFQIDAKVAVNVTPLGTVEYRFIQPGEAIESTAVSNVSLKVVPVPRQTQAGSWSPVEHTPSAGVDEIRGIGKQLAQTLNGQGIYTVGDLLHAGGRLRGSVELAKVLEVDRFRVDEWLAHAQLLTIRDVSGRIAGVLYEIGVRSLRDLAAREPVELAAAFNAQVELTGRKRITAQTAATVTPWIRAARNYLGQQQPLPPSTEPVTSPRQPNTQEDTSSAPPATESSTSTTPSTGSGTTSGSATASGSTTSTSSKVSDSGTTPDTLPPREDDQSM